MDETDARSSLAVRAAAVTALLVHVLLAVPLYFVQLLTPLWAMLAFYAVWAVLLVGALVLLHQQRWWLVVAVPLLLIVIVYASLVLGDLLLGWTA